MKGQHDPRIADFMADFFGKGHPFTGLFGPTTGGKMSRRTAKPLQGEEIADYLSPEEWDALIDRLCGEEWIGADQTLGVWSSWNLTIDDVKFHLAEDTCLLISPGTSLPCREVCVTGERFERLVAAVRKPTRLFDALRQMIPRPVKGST